MPTNFPTSVDNFTNPTANDSLNLPSHSTQHANANDAIEAIETFLLNGGQGMTLVKKVTVGAGVSSVVVSDAFSATYTNYKIIASGGAASTDNGISIQYGATTTGYYEARPRVTLSGGAVAANTTINGSAGNAGFALTTGLAINLEVVNPFLPTMTRWGSHFFFMNTTVLDWVYGMVNNSTSYTGFTLATTAGTLTGGTIYVYGYGTGQ